MRISILPLVASAMLLASPALADKSAPAKSNPCKSARAAAESFLDNLQRERFVPADSITCFQRVEGMSDEALIDAVGQLKAVLDAGGHFVDYDLLPDDPDFKDKSGRQRVDLTPTFEGVYITRIGDRWLFPRSVVRRIPKLYGETFSGLVESLVQLLPPIARTQVLGHQAWQFGGLALLLLLVIVLSRVTQAVFTNRLGRVLQRTGVAPPEGFLVNLARPLGWLVGALLFLMLLAELRFGISVARILGGGGRVVAAVSAALLGYRLVDLVAVFLTNRAADTETKMDDQLAVLVRKTLRVVVVGIGLIFVLQNLSVDVTGLIAGLGIGGLALALAAKDTAANLFGSFTIFIDAPFYVGDWIKTSGVEGTVLEIGLRSTRIRTFSSSVVSVPNSTLATATIENFSRREYRRFYFKLGIAYHSTPTQIEAFVEGVRAVIASHPSTRKDYYEVHLVGFADSALEVMVYTFFTCDSWTVELEGKHQILLAIKQLADRLGVEFAFPTRTLHIETQAEATDRAVPLPPAEDDMILTVRAFGPEGEFDVTGSRLTHGYRADTTGQRGSADNDGE